MKSTTTTLPKTRNPLVFEYSVGQEVSHAVTHGLGAALGIAALVLMIVRAAHLDSGVAWNVVGASLFGATIILLYLTSTLYHALFHEKAKVIFEIFDHQAIYLLIAGSYTPFALVTLREHKPWIGWTVFGVIWGLAVLGIVFKVFTAGKLRLLSTLLYVGMGWVVIFTIKPLLASLPAAGIAWLAAGGFFYTAGTAFYLWRKLRASHTIWHLFVLTGTICHFFCVFFHVIK